MEKKGMKRAMRRSVAWLLTLAMVLAGLTVPAKPQKAKAATVTMYTSTGDSSLYATVELDSTNKYASVYDQYNVVFHNNSAQSIAQAAWSLEISFDQNITLNAGWGATTEISGSTLKLTAGDYNEKALEAGGDVSMGIQVQPVGAGIVSVKLNGVETTGKTGTPGSGEVDNNRDSSSGVTATLTNQDNSPSNDWSGFDMTITNNSGSSICDWIVELQVPSGTASAFKCWNATFVADGDTIYMYPMRTGANAVLATGTMQNDIPGGGFSSKYVDASSIVVKKVSFNRGTTSQYDYSNGVTNDDNTSGGGSGSSTGDSGTNLDLEVEYDYAKLLQESLYFYDANMCGTQVDEHCALSWRGDCHTADASVICPVNNATVDVSGGFHDAGDHVKFGLPQGYASSMLCLSYYEFKQAYEELGQTEHLRTITDYFCDYYKRCTVYQDNDKKTGGVVAFCYQVGEGNSDHGYWGSPEKQTTNRPAYWATASNPATDEVSVAIATLALNYINFGDTEDLQVAKDLFAFVKGNSKSVATEGAGSFYSSTKWEDDYAVAASALYVATKDSSYKTEYENYKSGVNTGWVLTWDNAGPMASMLMGDWSTVATITNIAKQKTILDGVYSCIDGWGSCRYNATLQFSGLVYDKYNSKTYTTWAEQQMRYMLGENPNKRCYIIGYNENSSKYPHHRAASRSTGAGQINEEHYTLLGALVGGPTAAGYYKDDQGDYNCNEVALDYNAGLVGAAAGLYLATKGSTAANHSEALATAEELNAVGVTKYYGNTGSNPGQTVTDITLDQSSLSLVTNGTTEEQSAKLTPTVTTSDEETYAGRVTWTSDNTSVATVNANGLVTAQGNGTTTITVTSQENSSIKATCQVTVTTGVSEIRLDKTNLELYVGKTGTLAATVLPEDASNKKYSWSSSDENVAQVKDGVVTAKDKGEATITVTTEDGKKTATCAVVVKKVENPYTIDLSQLSDSNYVEALQVWDEASQSYLPTVNYQQSANTLTLTQEKSYTITGSCEGLTIILSSGVSDVTVKNAAFGSLDVSGSQGNQEDEVLLRVEGDNVIASAQSNVAGIQTGEDTTLVIQSTTNGILSVTGGTGAAGIADAGNLRAESGNITITGGSQAPAICVDNVELLGGNVTVKVAEGTSESVPAILVPDTGKIVVEQAQISSNASQTYSKAPVDSQGISIISVTITYRDELGNVLQESSVKKGSQITLPPIAEKQGYKKVWSCNDTTYQPGASLSVNDNMVFQVVATAIAVTGVSLKYGDTILTEQQAILFDTIGASVTVKAVITPENALNQSVTWSSDNPAVVSVRDGVLTAVAVGRTVVRAVTNDGNFEASVQVDVALLEKPTESPSLEPTPTAGSGEGDQVTPSPAATAGSGEGDQVTPSPAATAGSGEGNQVTPSPAATAGSGEGDQVTPSPAATAGSGEGDQVIPSPAPTAGSTLKPTAPTSTKQPVDDRDTDDLDEDEDEDEESDSVQVAKVTIKKISTGKKKLMISWNQGKNVDGYQIEISQKKNFAKSKKITVKSASKTKQTVTKLSKQKKYYVRIRAWKKVDQEVVYGVWSKVKSKKTK